MQEILQTQKDRLVKAILNEGMVKTEDVAEAIKAVLEVVKKVKAELSEKMANNKDNLGSDILGLEKDLTEMERKMSDMSKKMSDKMGVDKREMMEYCKTEMQKLEDMIPTIPSFEPLEKKIKEVEKMIPKIPAEITPYQVRNKLESIDNESEKLDINAIKDLKKELDDLKKKWVSRPIFGGGGFSKIAMESKFIDDETPSGTVNGVNTDFILANAPNPPASVKVFVNGQRMRITEDYTFSNRTITFLTAPPTGSIIMCDYRI